MATENAGAARAFEQAFALILATEYWARAIPRWSELGSYYLVSLPLVTALCVLAMTRWRRPAFAVLAMVHVGVIWGEFPATGNHAYLELIFCVLAASLDLGRAAEAALLVDASKWLVTVVFFYSGLQKVVHGYYFGGEMLAYSLGTNSFRPLLQWFLPATELQRLVTLTGAVGEGPYRVAAPLLLLASNGIWVGELALAGLLWVRGLTRWAVVAALLLLVAIEIGAREVFFGLVFTNALLLFVPGLNQRLLPWFVPVLVLLLLSRLGIIAEATFY